MTNIFTALFAWMCVLNGQRARAKGLSATKYQWITTACFGAVGIVGGIVQFVTWLNLIVWSASYQMQPWMNGGGWRWNGTNPLIRLYNGTLMGTQATMIWLLFVIIAAVVSYAITNSAAPNVGNEQQPPLRPTPSPAQPNPDSRAGQNSQWQAPTKENQSFEVDLNKENEIRSNHDGEWNK